MGTGPLQPQVRLSRRWIWLAATLCGLIGIGVVIVDVIPRFVSMATRAKSAEGLANLNAIHKAQLAYFKDHGEYLAAGTTPARPPGTSPTPFDSEHLDAWERLGWKPESPVRCQYNVTVPAPDTFWAVARCDSDGDGNPAVFTSSPLNPPEKTSPPNHY